MKPIDNEASKGNRCHVFQELVNHDEMLHSAQGFKSFFEEQERNIKIYIRKYRVVS